MLKNDKSLCPRTDEIVSYIYGESGVGTGAFETHLSDCVICTDEFAAVSNARFAVYEWHKVDFAHLPTPAFSVPATEQGASAGFLAGLRAFLGPAGLPVAVAALLLLAIGVGFLTFSFESGQVNNVAVNSVEQILPPAPVSVPSTRGPGSIDESLPESGPTTPAAIRVSQPTAGSTRKPLKKKVESRYANVPAVRRAPVLSPVEDDTDRTLRLTDLFDGVGGD